MGSSRPRAPSAFPHCCVFRDFVFSEEEACSGSGGQRAAGLMLGWRRRGPLVCHRLQPCRLPSMHRPGGRRRLREASGLSEVHGEMFRGREGNGRPREAAPYPKALLSAHERHQVPRRLPARMRTELSPQISDEEELTQQENADLKVFFSINIKVCLLFRRQHKRSSSQTSKATLLTPPVSQPRLGRDWHLS